MTSATQEFIGKGRITEANINSEQAFIDKMTKMGQSEAIINYIVYTALPKGHAEYMSRSAAAKKFFPNMSFGAVAQKAEKAYAQFVMELLHGQEAVEIQKEREEKAKNAPKKRQYNQVSLQDKAMKIAERNIGSQFRMKNGLADRGAIRKELVEAYNEYRIKHLEPAYNRVCKEMGYPVEQKQMATA